MAREELARLLSRLLKRGQSARCCNNLAEFESRLFAELLHWKNSFRWFRFLLLRGTAESGALKANALPGGARRLAVRAVKAAWFSRSSERSGRALTEEAGGPGAGLSAGRAGTTSYAKMMSGSDPRAIRGQGIEDTCSCCGLRKGREWVRSDLGNYRIRATTS